MPSNFSISSDLFLAKFIFLTIKYFLIIYNLLLINYTNYFPIKLKPFNAFLAKVAAVTDLKTINAYPLNF